MEPKKPFSPREFLKGRRPERFSDTLRTDQPVLERALLEYHLMTLTSRGQERDFELFARHLAQKEICPNLLPQTGPTGGGDSKVDSETYPVADDLSLAWFVGNAREAAIERWGFAFSAKEDWRPKVRSDVAKIATTGRGYKKAFFVTNQYVPDRVRADVEDELTRGARSRRSDPRPDLDPGQSLRESTRRLGDCGPAAPDFSPNGHTQRAAGRRA